MSRFSNKLPTIKHGQTDVACRHDGSWATYMVLTWADLDLVPPEITMEAIQGGKPYLNPLIWVPVAISRSRHKAIEEALRQTELLNKKRTALGLNSLGSPGGEVQSLLTALEEAGVSG